MAVNTTNQTEQTSFRYLPKEIIEDVELQTNIAWFDYESGIRYALENKLKQTTKTDELYFKKRFMVCCGEVAIAVKESDYPSIERRKI